MSIRSTSQKEWIARLFSTVLIVAGMAPPVALANPEGSSVSSGTVTIEETGNRVDIYQSSNTSIIDWRSFSIASGEVTQFHQPSSSSLSLNRVLGPNPSQIFGSLIANGQVILVNPNGILFGAGSVVDVAGLVATTANIRNQDFLAGAYDFAMASPNIDAFVVNQGRITIAEAGYAALVAPWVRNSGVISAKLGRVTLGGAETFTLDLYGDNLVKFQLGVSATPMDSNGDPVASLVGNSGRLLADGGRIVLAARNIGALVESVVNVDGVVRANSLSRKNGEVIIGVEGPGTVSVSGALSAVGAEEGETGGRVEITGERVGLFGGTLIDVSGMAGGGEVLVGGDYRGGGEIRNATATYMADTAVIRADALYQGDGGRVILWADDVTRFFGTITARGGAAGGDGGFVETSGKEYLEAYGNVDASAPLGAAGLWLLDPRNVIITGADSGGGYSGGDPNVFTPTADDATVNVTTIQASLNGGTSVTINTGSSGAQAGNITVISTISKSAGGDATLTLDAAGAVSLNQTVTSSSGALEFVVTAGDVITVASTISTNGGGITLDAGSSKVKFTSGGGTPLTTSGGAIELDSELELDGNSYTLDSGNGNVTLASITETSGTGSGLTVTAGTGAYTSTNADLGATSGILDVTAATIDFGGSLIADSATLNGASTGNGLAVTSLTITGDSADLNGTVNGAGGQQASINATMPDSSSYKINNCWQSGCVASATETVAIDSVTSATTTTTSTSTTTTTTETTTESSSTTETSTETSTDTASSDTTTESSATSTETTSESTSTSGESEATGTDSASWMEATLDPVAGDPLMASDFMVSADAFLLRLEGAGLDDSELLEVAELNENSELSELTRDLLELLGDFELALANDIPTDSFNGVATVIFPGLLSFKPVDDDGDGAGGLRTAYQPPGFALYQF